MRRTTATFAAATAILAFLSACGSASGSSVASATPAAAPGVSLPAQSASEGRRPTMLAVGDIGECAGGGDAGRATASLAATLPGPILALGDIAYPDGSQANYDDCFWPSWAPLRSRVKAVIGNHDNRNRSTFFASWPSAGTSAKPWYSFTVGSWLVLVVEANCSTGSPSCSAGAAQTTWLATTLAANKARCTVLAMHQPRFSSDDEHGDSPTVDALWRAAYSGGADLVLAGHAHDYERVGPLSVTGVRNTTGPVQLIVGTGGTSQRGFASVTPASRVRINDTFGLVRLTLTPGAWRSDFLAAPSGAVRDHASGACR